MSTIDGWFIEGHPFDPHFPLGLRAATPADALDLARYAPTIEDAWLLAFSMQCEAIAQQIVLHELAVSRLNDLLSAHDQAERLDVQADSDAARDRILARLHARIADADKARSLMIAFIPSEMSGDCWRAAEQHVGQDRRAWPDKTWRRHDGSLWLVSGGKLRVV